MTPDIRDSPRISLNKLAEYLVAAPRQRRRIIRDQKFPQTPPAIYYEPTFRAVTTFFTRGGTDDDFIIHEIEELDRQSPESDWARHRVNNNILALESFLDCLDKLTTKASRFESLRGKSAQFSVAGVDVSVRPEVGLRDSEGRVLGAFKLYLGKHDPLSERAAKLIATMLYLYLEDEYSEHVQKSESCIIDVFQTTITQAPRSYKRRSEDLAAACREIAAIWDGVEEKD